MAGTWKTVRVFISSTFSDMHAERDWLVKRVFPQLRENLEEYRIRLVDIDLRWGVTKEQVDDDQALDLCLQQIDECRPLFIGILGDRYGYVPAKMKTTRYGWIKQRTGKSITELEILHGVLNDHEMRSRSFFYFRDSSFLKHVPDSKLNDVQSDCAASVAKLAALKQTIIKARLPVYENYPCSYCGLKINWRLARQELHDIDREALWDIAGDGIVDSEEYRQLNEEQRIFVDAHSVVYLDGLQEFGDSVLKQLQNAILNPDPGTELARHIREVQQPRPDPHGLLEEADYHEHFMESRLHVYVGRERINRELMERASSASTTPCLVTGTSGCGKSSALAKFCHDYADRYRNAQVIPHFVGVSPTSRSLRAMLRRFCLMLMMKSGDVTDVPNDVRQLVATFCQLIANIPVSRRVIIVIDGLNRLDHAENAQHLHWLPRKLPPHVKLIVSCVDDSPATDEVLQAFEHREHATIRIGPLTENERMQIIRDVPSISAKILSNDQIRLLLKNRATCNPLFLLVALEELRGFGSFERLDKRIAAFPRERGKLVALFVQVIERLEVEFGHGLVRNILRLIVGSYRGLSEQELRELIPKKYDSAELFAVIRQLRHHLSVSSGLISFYHRGLQEAVQIRYLSDAKKVAIVRRRLADYRWDQFHGRTSAQSPYVVDDLPSHLVEAEQWERLKRIVLGGKINYISRWTAGGHSAQGRICLKALLEHARLPKVDAAGLATQLAQIYMTFADYEEAQRWLNQAVSATSWFRGRRVRSIAFHELASLCLYREQFSEAEKLYQSALNLCVRALPRHYDEAGANLIGLATVHHAQFEFDKAISRASAALKYSTRAGDFRHQIAARRLMAAAWLSLGELEQVDHQLQAAMKLMKKHEAAIEMSRVLLLQGRAQYVRATLSRIRPLTAVPLFEYSFVEAKRVNDSYGQVEALMFMAWASLACEETSAAAVAIQRAVNLLPPGSRPDLRVGLDLADAVRRHQQGELRVAEKSYLSASAVCVRHDLPSWQAKALVGAGSLQWHSAQQNRATQTWRLAHKAALSVSPHVGKLTEIDIEMCRSDARKTPR